MLCPNVPRPLWSCGRPGVRLPRRRGTRSWTCVENTTSCMSPSNEAFVNHQQNDLRRSMGVGELLAQGCLRCHRNRHNGVRTTTHASRCPRDGAQVNMYEPLKFAMSRALNGISVRHDVESGAFFTGERNVSIDIVITRRGALVGAPSLEYHNAKTSWCDPRRLASTSTLA